MFRLRITLLSVLFSGAVLVIFGLFFISLTSKMNMERIDREIKALGESQLVVLHPREYWDTLDASIRAIYGEKNTEKLMMRVVIAGGFSIYKSSNWPEQISPDSFSEFDQTLTPPPRPGRMNPEQLTGKKMIPMKLLKQPVFRTFHLPEADVRVGIMGNPYFTVLVGVDLRAYHQDARVYSSMFFLGIPIALLFLASGGWLVAHRALASVRLIARTTEKITAQDLHQRIPDTKSTTEFRQLIHVINDMLDRLETSFSQAARFSADAAHELQTPLTILQGVLDDAVSHAEEGSEEQQRSSNLLIEVQRLKVIVQKLLILIITGRFWQPHPGNSRRQPESVGGRHH